MFLNRNWVAVNVVFFLQNKNFAQAFNLTTFTRLIHCVKSLHTSHNWRPSKISNI